MFRSLRAREHEVLGPLLALARAQTGATRQAWLDDIRSEAPTVVARLERLLADAETRSEAAKVVADKRVPVAAPTAVPASRAPYWTAPPPRQLRTAASVGDPRESAAAPRARSQDYVAPSLAVGGLQR